MGNLIGHFSTITKHKIQVTALCFRCGLYKQGLLHDLSKYSWVEFRAGVKYFQGNRSPIDKEKEEIGFSNAWLHHKGRNKHHWEYWLDNANRGMKPLEMPANYVIEMFCDRVVASKIYQKEHYRDDSALRYYENGRDYVVIHPKTDELIMKMLTYLADNGLTKTITYIKRDIKNQAH